MKKKMRSGSLPWLLHRAFVISLLVSLFGPLAHAQDIRIRVLNARNGKPINNECVNVSLGSAQTYLCQPIKMESRCSIWEGMK